MGIAPSADSGRVVTVSATYGAGGSVIAPMLADALHFSFLDRTVSANAAVAVESPSAEEQASSPPSRWMESLAQLATTLPGVPMPGAMTHQVGDMRNDATAQVTAAEANGQVLILGRAAAVVLAGRPLAFHIRLDGPVETRIARAQEYEHIDTTEARRRCEVTDRLHAQFVRRLYNRDASDVTLYHLWLDSTVLDVRDVVSLLQTAALGFWNHAAKVA